MNKITQNDLLKDIILDSVTHRKKSHKAIVGSLFIDIRYTFGQKLTHNDSLLRFVYRGAKSINYPSTIVVVFKDSVRVIFLNKKFEVNSLFN